MKYAKIALPLATTALSIVLLYDTAMSRLRPATRKNRLAEKFYATLDAERRYSLKKLDDISLLLTWNSDKLPERNSNETAEEMCQNGTNCLPAFEPFETELRILPKYKMSTCVVQKSMSTVMTSLFCFLFDEASFIGENRDILKDWKYVRLCMGKNEHSSMNTMLHKYNAVNDKKWTHIMITRDPVDRFLSGFIDKCVR
ncbi:unnamed protein product [Caenorhabditis auriculariae]|uniref:Sulfotransferase domain-containing protein n=1 Tax=Caenorhabditis auriculariae TaxID=2777116 RepID=A0A8S1GUP9_9PELO|nr:unnamed protein product [Caenorhabditis auriculariae]